MLTLVLYVLPWVIIIACLSLWMQSFERIRAGQPLLSLASRRPVPWSLIDLLVTGFVGILFLVVVQVAISQQMDLPDGSWELEDLTPPQRLAVLVSFSASSLLGWLAALGVCRFRAGASWQDLGVVRKYLQSDVVLGIGVFAMLVVPMLLIHFLASTMLAPEEGHPFVQIIKDDPRAIYLAPIAFAAVIVAPLVEETAFRLLLQGWLERVVARYEASLEVAPLVTPESDQASAAESEQPTVSGNLSRGEGEPAMTASMEKPSGNVATADENPDMSSDADADADADQEQSVVVEPPARLRETLGLPRKPAWRAVPILISSLLFAGAHFGQGAAPIGLFFLALGLGYVYQRTHRIVPCIVVHVLVNLTAVLQLIHAVLNNTI